MMQRIQTIALHTFKESVREKVLYNLIVFALLLIGAAILFARISLGIERIMLVNLGLASIALFGLLMAIFIGIGLVSKEIERRTLYNILSKPVRRYEFVVGKYLGLLLTLIVNTAIMAVGFYAALYYVERRLGHADWAPLQAIYFILLQLAIVIGLALLFSCISSPALAAFFTFCFYIAGNFLGDIRGLGSQSGNMIFEKLAAVVYYALPNFSNFQVISQSAHGRMIPSYLLVSGSLYALLYVTVLISASALIFEEREF